MHDDPKDPNRPDLSDPNNPYAQQPNPPHSQPPQAPRPTLFRCVQCGYDLTGSTIGGTCPECGTDLSISLNTFTTPISGYAVASLVLGILSIVTCCFWGIPSVIVGPLAIVFAGIAKRNYIEGKCSANSLGLATAGRICGIIGLSISIAFIAFIIFSIVTNNM